MEKEKSKISSSPDNNFDWSIYEDGYDGGLTLKENRSIKTKKGDKVYCHESYAQELYYKMDNTFPTKTTISPKDSIDGTIYDISDIVPVSDHEIRIDSDNGMSSVVDINKETQFIKLIGLNDVTDFMEWLNNPDYKRELLKTDIVAKVVDKNRVSIWEGYRSKVEKEFMEDLVRKDGPRYAYDGKILELNNGGYTVDIRGVKCFLPSSLAASGPISDFEGLVGKNVKVCVVNFSPVTKNFVVSHKKYLEITLPERVSKELSIGKEVSVKVTGISKNGLFCAIKDNDGEFSFASLMHRSTMSSDAEAAFDKKEFMLGDQFHAYVHKILWDDNNQCRIVVGDIMPKPEDEKENDNENKIVFK